MSGIKARLLNRTVDIKMFGKTTKNSQGDFTTDEVTVGTDIKMRITTNKDEGDPNVPDNVISKSSHKGFMNIPTFTIEKDYFVVDGSETYKVIYVDKTPGGVMDHHYVLYIIMSSEMSL